MSSLQVQLGGNTVSVQVMSSGIGAALAINRTSAADAVAAEASAEAAAASQSAAAASASAAASTLAGAALKASNLSDLADGDAAFANLEFVQAGTGAVTRTARAKARDIVNALDYIPVAQHAAIAAGTSTYDATEDLQAALAANEGKTVMLPAGTIRLGQVGGLEFAGTRIVGDGRWETTIKPIAGLNAGEAIFYNPFAATASSAYMTISNIRFRFDGQNVTGVDLSSCNNTIVEQCYFAGTELGTAQVGVGVKFGSPLDSASYSNNVRDCAFYSLAKGVQYLVDANSNMITGGECIYCAIGVDAAPVGYLDTPRVIGMRFEGGGIGIKEKSDGANYIACRFESNSIADIDFIDNGGGDQSIRPMVIGGYTATSPTSLRNLANAVSPIIMSPDMGRYDIEASETPKFFHGRQVFAARNTALNPAVPSGGEYAAYFYDTPRIRNAVSLEFSNALETNSIIAVTGNASNQTVVRSFDRAAGIDREVILGGGSSVQPMATATTDLGSGAKRYRDGYFSGNLYSLTGVLSLEGAAGVVYVNSEIVLKARKTGWATATGTATRTTFDTTTVTLPQLAERMKALIDDLHATAGHGLIGT